MPSRRVLPIRQRGAPRGPQRTPPWLRTGAPVACVLSASRLVDHIFWRFWRQFGGESLLRRSILDAQLHAAFTSHLK